MTQRAGTASAARILDLLLTIADANHPVIAKDLADWSELPLSTVYRYLSLLRTKGLIWSIGSGQYAIGPRALQLARSFEESFSLAAVCRPLLQRLARDTDETVALVVPLGESAACVETVESPHALRYSFTRGAVLPLLRGASAKRCSPTSRRLPSNGLWIVLVFAGRRASSCGTTSTASLDRALPRVRVKSMQVSGLSECRSSARVTNCSVP